jgi:tripartite-type tricarboxylate transporter receptor subunit TctC
MNSFIKCLFTSLLIFSSTLSNSQSYPEKTIRLVIPYPAGGGIDLVGRPLAEKLSEALGKSVWIDNKGGASGILAMKEVAMANPDGYTIILALNTQIAVNPTLFNKIPYDSIKDFEPVSLIGAAPYILVANTKLPFDNVADMVSFSKSKPGGISYASAGNGSGAHLSGEMTKTMTGANLVHVPYKAVPASIIDVISGNVDVTYLTIASARGHIKSGKLKAIAVTSPKRSAAMPEVPTVAESGLPNFDSSVWYGIFAPAGTPSAIITKLNYEIQNVIKSADYQKLMGAEAVDLKPSTPDQFRNFISSEIVKWSKVVKDSGAKLD